jgi:hypothetical protein
VGSYPDEVLISKSSWNVSRLQCAAYRWLAEEEASGRSGDVTLFREDREDDQEIEIGLPQLRCTHNQYMDYALYLC